MFRPIDLYLYDKVFSPFSEWLHKRFGFGNFVIAKWLLFVGVALMLTAFCMLVAVPWSSLPNEEITHLYLLGPLLLFEAWFAYRILRKTLELEIKHSNQTSNQLSLRDFRDGPYPEVSLRRFFLFTLMVLCMFVPGQVMRIDHRFLLVPEIFRISSMAFVLIGSYFMAAPPRMPRKREKRVSVPMGVTVPVRS